MLNDQFGGARISLPVYLKVFQGALKFYMDEMHLFPGKTFGDLRSLSEGERRDLYDVCAEDVRRHYPLLTSQDSKEFKAVAMTVVELTMYAYDDKTGFADIPAITLKVMDELGIKRR